MTEEPDEGFIGRWSRRKRGDSSSDAGAPPELHETIPDETDNADLDAEKLREFAENRTAAEAVDLEAIDYDSDLSVFYKEGVPALLKQAALRKMWRSSPVFANLDGLNDYDQDFNVIDKVLTEFKSAWQLGRGYVTQVEETSENSTIEGIDDEGAAEIVSADETAPSNAGADQPEHSIAIAEDENPVDLSSASDPVEEQEIEADTRPSVSLRRRMAQFDDQ